MFTAGLEGSVFNCIAFDGGGTTGWALMSIKTDYFLQRRASLLDNVVFWAAGQYIGPTQSQVAEAAELCAAWAPQYLDARTGDWAPRDNLAIVAEHFTLRQFRMDPTLLLPVEFNAALRQELYHFRPRRLLFTQQPAMAMTSAPDSRLLAADAYATGGRLPGGYHAQTRGREHLRRCSTTKPRISRSRNKTSWAQPSRSAQPCTSSITSSGRRKSTFGPISLRPKCFSLP